MLVFLARTPQLHGVGFEMQPPAFHRAYRHVEVPSATIAWNVVCALIPALVMLSFAGPIINGHAKLVMSLVTWAGVPALPLRTSFGALSFAVPTVAAQQQDVLYAATLAIVAGVIALAVFLFPGRATPSRVVTGFIAFVCSVSGFFFWFSAERFPYAASDFASSWCSAEFVVWLVIPVLFAVILSPLPLSAGESLLFTSEAVLYAMWFSAIRLTLLLIVFHAGGLVWMAPAYFACGFLIDFVYIVAYYSLAVARASRRLVRHRDLWRW